MSTPKYDHQKIEKKWQTRWVEEKTFAAEENSNKPKYYVLDMFPYPSGAGLHVGHVTGYTTTDIISRYKRQQGFNVLHPMAWDSFGLPAEQYAVRTGTHPKITTKKNIDTYRRQLQGLGFSYDWDREFATTDPEYYKWTQWIFTKLYEKGLAYEAEMLVNFCPNLGTVLANEEIEGGKSAIGGHPVERRPLKQWILKITEYADRLLEDLGSVKWPKHIKTMQENWIGRSEGALVAFEELRTGSPIEVFTTRPDTLFGVSFMVLSPEHPLVDKITEGAQKKEVDAYKKETASKSDLERAELNKDKTGVWTGAYVENPVNGEKVPVWIADYVLMGYGTGAVMAVPGHDERDNEFAKKYKLPIRTVIAPKKPSETFIMDDTCFSGKGDYVHSSNGDLSLDACSQELGKKRVAEWLEKKGSGKKSINYKLRDWLFSRQRYWGEPFPLLHLADGTVRSLELDELPLIAPEVADFKPCASGESPLAKASDWINTVDPKTGQAAKREANTMPQWAGSCWYFLRFIDPHNSKEAFSKEADQYWMPVDMYIGGAEHAVTHLLYSRFWHKVLYDIGCTHTNEPFKRYCNVGMVTANAYKLASGKYIAPKDVKKIDGKHFHIETDEKVSVLVEKMSKSKLNGVSPDDIVDEFGADSLRMYEVFMGPLDQEKFWNDEALPGCYRFLSRVYQAAYSEKVCDEDTEKAFKLSHKMASGVRYDLDNLLFNTAIAKMMEFLNAFTKLDKYPKNALKILLQSLHPFAPHISSELWGVLGGEGNISYSTLTEIDKKYLIEDSVTYVVQVNGKVRGKFDLPKDSTEEELLNMAKEHEIIRKHLGGKEIRKIIYVPNKLLNLVV